METHLLTIANNRYNQSSLLSSSLSLCTTVSFLFRKDGHTHCKCIRMNSQTSDSHLTTTGINRHASLEGAELHGLVSEGLLVSRSPSSLQWPICLMIQHLILMAGTVLEYTMAGCPVSGYSLPCDCDIDCYMGVLLQGWLGASPRAPVFTTSTRPTRLPDSRILLGLHQQPVAYPSLCSDPLEPSCLQQKPHDCSTSKVRFNPQDRYFK